MLTYNTKGCIFTIFCVNEFSQHPLPRKVKSGLPATIQASRIQTHVPQTHRLRVRILATSDLHMNLTAYDYHADRPCVSRGLSLTAGLIAQARQEVPEAILIDNGDFLQGSPLGDYAAEELPCPHPMIQAMNHLGYDAVNIGNHEFSHGIDTLTAALHHAAFPVLSANTLCCGDSGIGQQIQPWVILDRSVTDDQGQSHRVRLGLVGVLPPETEIWDRQAIKGQVRMVPMAQTVARCVPEMRAAGADVVVVLAHCGIGAPHDGCDMQDGALHIARIDGVDAVVMGHVHRVFPSPDQPDASDVAHTRGTIANKPAVMPGFFGSHLGVIDLMLARTTAGWHVETHRVEARPIFGRDGCGTPHPVVAPDAPLATMIRPFHDATRTWARRPIGRTPRAIHSFFAMISDCPSVRIVNQAQAAFVAARLAGGPFAHLPVLSSTAPFRAGGLGGPDNYTFIPAGDLLLRHAADLYIHPNTIMALRLTGAEIARWLEFSVQGYNRVTAGASDQPLIRQDLPSFLYDTISGVSYEIDLSANGAQRIHNLRWNGKPMDGAQEFILATNSYRGSGSGGYAPVDHGNIVLSEQVANRDILIAHMASHALEVPPRCPPAWRFRAMPGSSVTFDTSPLAVAYLDDVPGLSLTVQGKTAEGFLRLRLDL